jgi:hypothetical protein
MDETTDDTTADEHTATPDHRTVPAISRHLSHPLAHVVVHVLGLVAAHTAALLVIEKVPLLVLLLVH